MAPQNLNQVFVINNPDMISTTTFANNAAASISQLSVWDVDNTTNFVTALRTSGVWNKKRIQIVQTMPSGNPIATPIIDTADIRRINYREWTSIAISRATQTIDFQAPTASKDVMLRIALRTAPTAYANYYQDGTAVDLSYTGSGTAYEFPLLGNFSAGRMIFNIEVPASVHGGSETALTTAMYNAILNNKTFNALFSATDSGTSGLVMIARHWGVEFDVTSQYSDKTGAVGTVTASRTYPAGAAGTNYAIALSAEKAQRARYGNFNRMYFPYNFPTFAQPGFKYDVIEIQYEHGWPSSTGIARAGELNTVTIFLGNSSTALTYAGASTGTEVATVFGFTGGADSDQIL